MTSRTPVLLAVGLLALAGPLAPSPGGAQAVTERSPNLSGGWVGSPGTLEFTFNHRFWLVDAGDEEKLVNSPSFLLAWPLPNNLLLAAQYASNSQVLQRRFNEWELLGRWAPLQGRERPVEMAVTAGYNVHMGSADGELTVVLPLPELPLLPMDGLRILGAARGFSDVQDSGEAGWYLGAGLVVPLTEGVSLAGDVGSLRRDGEALQRAWGAGLQLRIPTTPHTLSLQATNTRTGTLQGSSIGGRTTWGFEFTIPFTLARYFRGTRPSPDRDEPVGPAQVPEGDPEVEVTMTELAFAPRAIRVQAGQTVVWKNTSPLVHTVTADPEAVGDPDLVLLPGQAEPFDSGNLFPGEVFRHTFTVPGEYLYICIPHEMVGMVGTVIVEP